MFAIIIPYILEETIHPVWAITPKTMIATQPAASRPAPVPATAFPPSSTTKSAVQAARRGTYPRRMAGDMGGGMKVYVLCPGQGTRPELVPVMYCRGATLDDSVRPEGAGLHAHPGTIVAIFDGIRCSCYQPQYVL